MTAQEIAQEIFRGSRTAEWVRRNFPNKITIGHSTVRWWEADAIESINSRRDVGSDNPPQGGLT